MFFDRLQKFQETSFNVAAPMKGCLGTIAKLPLDLNTWKAKEAEMITG